MTSHKIYIGDCTKTMKMLPAASIDFVLTDPPYNVSSDLKIVMKNHPNHPNENDRELCYDFGEWDKFESDDDYLKFTEKWISECYHILKPSGNLVTFFNNWLIGDLKRMWENLGGRARQKIYWHKTNPKPRLRKVDFQQSVEELFWGAKSKHKHTFNYGLGQHHNLVESAVFYNSERCGHPNQKPERILVPLIKYLSNEGDTIFDPFWGVGTTTVVAQKLGRNSIGIEINPEYVETAKKRLRIDEQLTDGATYEFIKLENDQIK